MRYRFFDGTVYRGSVLIDQSNQNVTFNLPGSGLPACPLATIYAGSGTLRVVIEDDVQPADVGNQVYALQVGCLPINPTAVAMLSDYNTDANNVFAGQSANTGTWPGLSSNPACWNEHANYANSVAGNTWTWSFSAVVPGTYKVAAVLPTRQRRHPHPQSHVSGL